jgi:6-pyruvoyltetrahydropterin/6-carboxytetrahydropterin synthase
MEMSMRITLSKAFEFSASHRLFRVDWTDEKNYEVYGKCSNPGGHGHNYRLIVSVVGSPDPESGMIIDAGLLKSLVTTSVLVDIDHRNINQDVPWMSGVVPTVEVLAQAIWTRLGAALDTLPNNNSVSLEGVELWETSSIVARVVRQ